MIEVKFENGKRASEYVAELRNYRSVVRALVEVAEADPDHIAVLKTAAEKYPQPVRATAMTEDWCGDSACNMPVLTKLFEGAGIEFVVFHGSEYPELEKYYNDLGVDHIPVISLWDGEGNEIGRFVEQPASIDPLKSAWKAERPEFMELYAKRNDDKEAGRAFAKLYRGLLEEMSGWYRDGKWKDTTREVVEILQK
jgi:hypothetical protein